MDTLLRRRQMMAGGSQPAPLYTHVDYIETDGTAYIDTGIKGSTPRSATMKIKAVAHSTIQYFLGVYASTGNKLISLCSISSSKLCCFAQYTSYTTGAPSVSNSITNGTPFEVKTSLKQGAQTINVKQEGESSFTSFSKADNRSVSNTSTLYLFAGNDATNGNPERQCQSGSRVYDRVKIYSDDSYNTLVFDGETCYYEGEYGLWDHVSNSFKGNAAGSGAFTGPSIS